MSDAVDVTERQVLRVLKDLAEAGMIAAERHGRRNSYAINGEAFDPWAVAHLPVHQVLDVLTAQRRAEKRLLP